MTYPQTIGQASRLCLEMRNNTAVIPIYGALVKRAESLDTIFETESYTEIKDSINQALDDEEVNQILLNIDSPGGEVSGLFELCDFIQKANNVKPIYAIANDYAYSAAYAIASSCRKIFLTPTGGVGSIGVICNHVDISKMNEMEGVKVTSVFAGMKKNYLSPNEPLKDEAKSELQKEVDRLYGMFVQHISKNCGLTEKQVIDTQAGIFHGEEAILSGLADEISNMDEALERIQMETEENKKGESQTDGMRI